MLSDAQLKENKLEYITRISIISTQYLLLLIILFVFKRNTPFFFRYTCNCMKEDSFIVEYQKLYIENYQKWKTREENEAEYRRIRAISLFVKQQR